MKRKMVKKLVIVAIICYVIMTAFYSVKAVTLGEMQNKANAFITKGSQNQNINYGNVTKQFSDLGQILTMIGAGVMVGVTTYMGIKYLTAGPEAQAKLKIQLIGLVVSGMVIFGAYFIWKIVLQIASTF